MTHLPRPTLRALRSVVARALGLRHSRVRIVDRVYPHLGRVTDRETVVRIDGHVGDGWCAVYGRKPDGPRWAVRYLTARARRIDLP